MLLISCIVPRIGNSSTQTMFAFMHHVGASLRSALCATCHSAVLPARGYPSLFGSQCRLVANCQQRADTTYGICCLDAFVQFTERMSKA